MYLTRFEINPRRRDARAMLASPQRLHAAVLAAFSESEDAGRVLWRLDEGQHDVILYIVGSVKPDLTHLVESIGRPSYGWQTRDYRPFLDRLTVGDRWAFRLLANPVHSVRPDGGGRGKRLPHVTVAQQTTWLLDRAERHGFTVPLGVNGEADVAVRARRTLRFDRRGKPITLATALFEGTLHVADPDQLRAAMVSGIGPAKGYGCGLITLAAP